MRENLIPFPYNQSSKKFNGIDFVVNADKSISVNGTATAEAYFNIRSRNAENWNLPEGKYFLKGCPYGGNLNSYKIRLGRTNEAGGYTEIASDIGEGVMFEALSGQGWTNLQLQIIIPKDVTVNNLVFRPSIIKVYDYTQPKTDWIADDYFNITDYERIVGNIIETQDFASSLYSGYDIAEMMENVNYESVPHADTWNVISENIGTINQHTYNLPLQPSEVYVDNGYAPNYQEFNRWESNIERLMTTLRVEASTIPRLAKTLGRPMIGNR